MDTITKLVQAERDEQQIPEEWLDVVEGRASAERIAQLEARAEHDEEAAFLLAAFRPMSATSEEALVQSLLPEKKVVPMRPRRRIATAFVTLAAAAAAMFFVVRAGSEAPVPAYHLEASTPDLEFRGATKTVERPKHHTDSGLAIVLRPERAFEGDVAIRTFVEQNGARAAVDLPVEVSERRAVRIDGVVSELLPGRTGELTLVFVVGEQELRYDMEITAD